MLILITRKRIWIASFCLILLVIVGYKYYLNHFSNDGIYKNVTQRNGYSLYLQPEQIPIKLFIEPEWIDLDDKEVKQLNIKLLELYDSSIYLDNVWNRGNDLYFSFKVGHNFRYKSGEFLYNGVFNGNNNFTTSYGLISLYDIEQNVIPVGQRGFGPRADFSFGVQPENYSLISSGFYVNYNGFLLYSYAKN